MAKVKVGVAGVGVMGEHHTRIYSILDEAKLIGVYDFNPDRAREVAAKYGCDPYANLSDLLNQVSALTIASPTSTHYEVAINCLKAGKHLLVEKPLAGNHKDAAQIASEAKAYNCILASGMIERFNPAFQKAFSLVKNDKILGMEFKRYSPLPARITDASVVMDVMFHDIDLALALARIRHTDIKASGRKVKTDRLDEAQATIYFADGLIAKIEASRVKDEKKRHISITTDKAIYEVDLLAKRLYKREFETLTNRQEIEVKTEDQLTLELKDFLHAIDQGRSPRVPGESSLIPIEIAEEVERLACL